MTGRLGIDDVTPNVGDGHHPSKAVVGEVVPVGATVWREGHDAVAATVVWKRSAATGRAARPDGAATRDDVDRFTATVVPDEPRPVDLPGRRVERSVGDLAARRRGEARGRAGRRTSWPTTSRSAPGCCERVAPRGPTAARQTATCWSPRRTRCATRAAAAGAVAPALVRRRPDDHGRAPGPRAGHPRRDRTRSGSTARARCSAPGTSSSRAPPAACDETGKPRARHVRHGHRASSTGSPRWASTSSTCRRSTRSAQVNRKGPNNTLVSPGPSDVGSPWAIGSAEGGHDAIHPDARHDRRLRRLRRPAPTSSAWRSRSTSRCSARRTTRGSPSTRSGSPPAPTARSRTPRTRRRSTRTSTRSTSTTTPPGIYAEVLRVVLHWVEHGVRIFRVDNPHTKPPNFWHWLICAGQGDAPGRAVPGRGVHPAGAAVRPGHGSASPSRTRTSPGARASRS